jgi:C1A family cysteine protease
VDLSEAQLFFCIASTDNCNCETGWWPPKALDGYKNTGIVDDSCFPYTDHDQACNLCSNWQSRVTKITGWHEISATAEMKTWLSTKGPLVSCLSVYDDFFAYTSGIYTYVSGPLQGGHCICIVGYDDNQGCWIGKNSWGTAWGENGFFRIAYGQCGIDATMWAVEGIVVATQDTNWVNNILIAALYATDQDRNAWAYLDGIGWRQIASNDNNIFYNLLSLLLAAKTAKRQCNVYVDHGVITQVYVL